MFSGEVRVKVKLKRGMSVVGNSEVREETKKKRCQWNRQGNSYDRQL